MNLEHTVVGIAVAVIIFAVSRVRTLSYFQRKPTNRT